MELKKHAGCLYCGTSKQGPDPYCCRACQMLAEQIRPTPVYVENPYQHLDQTNFRDLYRQKSASQEESYTFYVSGLQCSSCVHLLEKLPEFDPEILRARVHFGKSTVTVWLPASGSLAQVAYLIERLGYQPTPLSVQDQTQAFFEKENRSALIKIGVAGFCAGNIMLFVIPVYAGLLGQGALVFNWISFFLFLPILFFSATPFYRGAWNSLKYRTINVDLPITLALWLGFSLSVFNLIRGHLDVYFDSTASFLFFILCARYFLKKTQQAYLAPDQKKSLFQNEKYTRLDSNGKTSLISWEQVTPGDELVLLKNQTLPAEAELRSAHGTFDLSLFNGESLPRTFSQGMSLFGGTKLLDDQVTVKITHSFEQSRIGQIFQQLEENASRKNHFTNLTDKLSRQLILAVFTISAVFFIFYSQIDASEAFNRSLALVVLACPCALAFGTPLTYGLALRKARTQGILLKDSSVLDRILPIRNLFFDKTGTLTEGTLTLTESFPAQLDLQLKRIVLSLESLSHHPIAFALRKAWTLESELLPVQEPQEKLGKGIRGMIDGDAYEIHDLAESTHLSEIGVEVFKNKISIARLYFSDRLRQDSASSIRHLQRQGFQCFLLSGDKLNRVQSVAEACSLPTRSAFGELYPEDKKALLEKHRPCCMIGDGANDALGLQTADIGIAVQGSVELSLSSADVSFTRGGLAPLLDLLKLAQRTRSTLIRNLTLSLVYNGVGGLLALCGWIDPLAAAVLMPISSVAIILSSLWGFR